MKMRILRLVAFVKREWREGSLIDRVLIAALFICGALALTPLLIGVLVAAIVAMSILILRKARILASR